MADRVEMQDIRGLEIDKVVKGFALVEYQFKSLCNVSSTSADHIRWYQETAADLTPTAPQKIANISPLSTFPTLEVSWTRQTSYVQKYAAESMISMEDMKSADIDVVARTLLRLTRAVVKQVDTKIYDVITDGISGTSGVSTTSASGINVTHASGAWNSGTLANPVVDILAAKTQMYTYNYNPEGATLFMSPSTHKYLLSWLINTKGANIPSFASQKIQSGVVMEILGVNVRVSNNVTGGASGAAVLVIPQAACTWKSFQDTSSVAIEEPMIGTKFRVSELGIPILTDPRAVTIIKGVDAA